MTNAQKPGCTAFGQSGCTLNLLEARTHFSAWAIVSAPLVLGNDITDSATMDAIWPIISNKEVLAVNDAWAGDAGVLLEESSTQVRSGWAWWCRDSLLCLPIPASLPCGLLRVPKVHLLNCSWFDSKGCDHPAWMVWKKDLPNNEVAVLLMNNDDKAADVTVEFSKLAHLAPCPAAGCCVRDVHEQKAIGVLAGSFTATPESHDSAFIVVSAGPC